VGYCGGHLKNPTYYNMGDHTETLQIDFDPAKLSYADLLRRFWAFHDPSRRAFSRQYMAAVFSMDEEQERLASLSAERLRHDKGWVVHTKVLPATTFYPAEAYHQKFRLRQHERLADEYLMIYPDEADFVNSTAVARVNGYLGGYGTTEQLDAEISGLGLSEEGRRMLTNFVQARHMHDVDQGLEGIVPIEFG